jgi:diaminopimelate decarboxylase
MLLGSQTINAQGRLEIGGCDTVELAQEFGTPLYVLDEGAVRDACRGYVAAFEAAYPRNQIHYASKAFLCTSMARIVDQEGLGLDVASAGELHTALCAGFPPSRINVHGNNKSADELTLAVSRKVGHITLDNLLEVQMLAAALRSRPRRVQDVLVRCAPGVDPETHRFIRTGQADTKFGFNIADGSALRAVRAVLADRQMRFRGIHFHVGSQLTDAESHIGAIEAAVGLMADIWGQTGVTCEVLNIGGGLGVRYRSGGDTLTFGQFAAAVVGSLREALGRAGLPEPVLAQEPGRAIVGEAGTTLYTVGAVKTVPTETAPGTRTYASVDGGLSDNPRPQLYDAVYEAVCASRAREPHENTITLAGKHCETDVLIWDARLPALSPGDIVAVQTTGAYNHAMASNYNRFPKPAVVLVGGGVADVIVRRETLADVVRCDRVPARLADRAKGK